jgi:stage V sporulation protein G
MQITDVRVRKVAAEGKMKAIVSVTFDDALAVHDIKVIEGQDKLFLAMPSKRMPDGSFRDIVHPINAGMREEMEQAVIERYKTTIS